MTDIKIIDFRSDMSSALVGPVEERRTKNAEIEDYFVAKPSISICYCGYFKIALKVLVKVRLAWADLVLGCAMLLDWNSWLR